MGKKGRRRGSVITWASPYIPHPARSLPALLPSRYSHSSRSFTIISLTTTSPVPSLSLVHSVLPHLSNLSLQSTHLAQSYLSTPPSPLTNTHLSIPGATIYLKVIFCG
ncbi:hypothetical protein E2C01_088625 [Portunus trituberculatus]|uniref:Uncharacterized protein n=1 Tax=Portunus trituberculatus TaxID=210409 RepID=A0A5B7JFY7_PORTR|nr:hypothetical protein [Portunus trituberculatus]